MPTLLTSAPVLGHFPVGQVMMAPLRHHSSIDHIVRDRHSLLRMVGVASAVPAAVATALTAMRTVRAWMSTPRGYTSDEWWFSFPVDDD